MDKDTQIKEEQVAPINESNVDYKDQYWEVQMEIIALKKVCRVQAELIAKLLI